MRYRETEKLLGTAAAKAGMDEKTARKYVRAGRSPSELKKPHAWRTRPDAFEDVWGEVRELLEDRAGLEGKTLFAYLQRQYPGRFQDGQLRTLQRRIKVWRAHEGPAREVMFPQRHEPGRLCQSDFTHMGSLGVTIAGEAFAHLIYHFVLTFSNWESGTVCFSESFESLAEGLQNALWRLGGVPQVHQTDCLTSAVNKLGSAEEFTDRYRALLAHYGLAGLRSQPRTPHENGDVEQRNHRLKGAMEQALILRGSWEFESREAYEGFVQELFDQLNAGRSERLRQEMPLLRRLALARLAACQRVEVRVGPSSTIRVQHNTYSVHSRLIGETVEARVHAEHIEIWHGSALIERLPRLRGEGKQQVNYRHIIDWLVRKPGAFERYLYRDALFPSSRFRMAFDALEALHPGRGHKDYLQILKLAARENEAAVDSALDNLLSRDEPLSAEAVEAMVKAAQGCCAPREVAVDPVDLGQYDYLLCAQEEAV
jgi:transposase